MKHLIAILLITVLGSCSTPSKPRKAIFDKSEINLNDVQSITIGKSQKDSTAQTLNNQETEEFVNVWNGVSSNGMCKYLPKFWITVYGKDSTERSFRINGKTSKKATTNALVWGMRSWLRSGINDECYSPTAYAEKE